MQVFRKLQISSPPRFWYLYVRVPLDSNFVLNATLTKFYNSCFNRTTVIQSLWPPKACRRVIFFYLSYDKTCEKLALGQNWIKIIRDKSNYVAMLLRIQTDVVVKHACVEFEITTRMLAYVAANGRKNYPGKLLVQICFRASCDLVEYVTFIYKIVKNIGCVKLKTSHTIEI